jgi:hypothetical protein
MDKVYLLWHSRPTVDDEEDLKFIGVYATENDAMAAQVRLKDKPGFSNYPEGFQIAEETIGRDHWEEGFISWAESLDAIDDNPTEPSKS